MTTHFPTDLLDLQRELQQTRAAYAALCTTLPWSAEPLDGWTTKGATATAGPVDRPPSPGYTVAQREQERDLFVRLRELSIAITAHPHWQTLQGPARVAARTQLKHTLDDGDDDRREPLDTAA
ncbi:hypothetical protein ACXZ65_38070 [Streptomyces aculeolatus]